MAKYFKIEMAYLATLFILLCKKTSCVRMAAFETSFLFTSGEQGCHNLSPPRNDRPGPKKILKGYIAKTYTSKICRPAG